MIEIANLALLFFGFVLVLTSLTDFTRAFSLWWALFPLVMKLTPIDGLIIPSCRFITVGLFAVAVLKFQGARNRFPRSTFWWSYVAFVFLASVSAIISDQPLESLGRTFTYAEPFMWALMAAFCVSSNKDGMRRIAAGIVCGLAGVAAYGIIEIVYQRNPLYDLGLLRVEADYINELRLSFTGRIISTIGQPVGTALYFVTTLPLAIFYAKYLSKSVVTRFICLLVAAAGLLCLIATGTRSGYAAILVVPLAYYAFNITNRRTMIAVVSTYALFFILVQYVLPPDFRAYNVDSIQIGTVDPTNAAVGSVLGRITLTQRLLDIARENPFLGLGPGYVPRMDRAGVPVFVGLGGSENQYAMLLVETGAVGVVGFAIFVFFALRVLIATRKQTSPAKIQWGAFAGSVFVSILLVATTVTIIASIMMMLIMTYLGIAVVLAREASALKRSARTNRRKVTVTYPMSPASPPLDLGELALRRHETETM
jgi:hypothetical protein